jgi:hypothetical protein
MGVQLGRKFTGLGQSWKGWHYVETTKTKGENSVSREPPEIKTNFTTHRSAGGILTELLKQKQWLGSMGFLASLLFGVTFSQLWERRLRNSRVFSTNFANLSWTMMIKSMIWCPKTNRLVTCGSSGTPKKFGRKIHGFLETNPTKLTL